MGHNNEPANAIIRDHDIGDSVELGTGVSEYRGAADEGAVLLLILLLALALILLYIYRAVSIRPSVRGGIKQLVVKFRDVLDHKGYLRALPVTQLAGQFTETSERETVMKDPGSLLIRIGLAFCKSINRGWTMKTHLTRAEGSLSDGFAPPASLHRLLQEARSFYFTVEREIIGNTEARLSGVSSQIGDLPLIHQILLVQDDAQASSEESLEAERCAAKIFIALRAAYQALLSDRDYHQQTGITSWLSALRMMAIELCKFIEFVQENPAITLSIVVPPLLEAVDKALVDTSSDPLGNTLKIWKNVNQARIILCEHSCQLPKSILLQLEGVQMSKGPIYGGGYADIYRDKYKGREVALKRFRMHAFDGSAAEKDQLRKKIFREIALQYGLCHSNICSLIGAIPDEDSKVAYPVLPWYGRGTVTEVLKGNKFTREKAFRFLVEISDGIHYLHEEGFAHGDLHPGNILVDDDGHIRLCDFGISQIWDSRLNSGTLRPGARGYMAPEILNVDPFDELARPIRHTPESDVYSFGVVCWTIFKGNPSGLHRKAPIRPELPVHRAIPDDLWRIMLKCWQQRPEDRIKTAELGEKLRALTR